MKITRIDAFEMNLEECAVMKKYKLGSTKGMGEKRIYVGHDEALLDDFFDLENIESFFFLKKDLQKYLVDAKEEFFNPVQEYKENISLYYDENVSLTNAITTDMIKLHFTKKYDSQNRYYLNFAQDGYSSKNYDLFRRIALPRVTKLSFVKVKELNTNKLYIYIKPFFFIDEAEKEEKQIIEDLMAGNTNKVIAYRKKQVQFRRDLFDEMPACIITKVTEDRILEACHIKPYNVCDEDEKYDVANGLVMTPTYHKLFDLGFISFDDKGCLLISPYLSNMNKKRLCIIDNAQYMVPKKCAKYLSYHRENIFNKLPDVI